MGGIVYEALWHWAAQAGYVTASTAVLCNHMPPNPIMLGAENHLGLQGLRYRPYPDRHPYVMPPDGMLHNNATFLLLPPP
jgi:hypothetical protein